MKLIYNFSTKKETYTNNLIIFEYVQSQELLQIDVFQYAYPNKICMSIYRDKNNTDETVVYRIHAINVFLDFLHHNNVFRNFDKNDDLGREIFSVCTLETK